MTTETTDGKKPVSLPDPRGCYRRLEAASMIPPSTRMIMVEIYYQSPGYSVRWQPVLGIMMATVTEYRHPSGEGRWTQNLGMDHEGLIKKGWFVEKYPEIQFLPIVPGDMEEPTIYAAGDGASSLRERVVIACDWPPSDDRENALRVAQNLLQSGVIDETFWMDLDGDGEEVE